MNINSSKIRILMADNLLSATDTATLAGMDLAELCHILKRGKCYTATAGRIAKALNVSVSEILDD